MRDIIIVCDESDENCSLIEEAVSKTHYRYYRAKDEADCVRSVGSFNEEVAMVIVEARQPDMNGRDILESINHLKVEYHFKTIGMAERPTPKLITSFIEADADDFLTKSITKDSVLEVINEQLDLKWKDPISIGVDIPFSHPFFKVKSLELISFAGLTFKFKSKEAIENQKMLRITMPLEKLVFEEDMPTQEHQFKIVNMFKDHGGFVYYTHLFGLEDPIVKRINTIEAPPIEEVEIQPFE